MATRTARTYRNPPIEEAVVEFRFQAGQEWDLTIPGKVHQHPLIKDVYTGKPRQRIVMGTTLVPGSFAANVPVEEQISRVQLVSSDAKRLLTLGDDVMSISVLRPYDGWTSFRPRIEAALSAYREVASPAAVSRIGVRYINKIVIPGDEVDLATYLTSAPVSSPHLPDQMSAYFCRVQYVYPDAAKLIFTQGTSDAPDGSAAIMLDFDVVRDGPIGLDEVMKEVEEMHRREGAAFEATLTDTSRGLFDGN